MPKSLSSYALYLLITVLVVSLYLGDFTGLKKLQWSVDDLMYAFRGDEIKSTEIVLVEIDDASCDQMGDWPWSYDILADLVATCNSGKPKSILMNLDLSSKVSEDTLGNTQILANQISWVDNITLTYDIALAEYTQHRMSKPRYLHKSSIRTNSEFGILKDNQAINIRRPFLPSSYLTQYASSIGFTYVEFDEDRRVRTVPLVANYDGFCYPSAPLLGAADYLGFGPDDIIVNAGQAITFGNHAIPIDEAGRFFINYGDPGSTFVSYSASDLINERVDLQSLKDKLVIIGLTQFGAEEVYRTPVADKMSRLELFASVSENIIQGNYITKLDYSTGINILVLFGFGLFCAVFLPRVTILYRMVILFICLFILTNLNFILFNSYSLLTKSLYLGLEIVLFMLASPLLNDSNRPNGFQFGFLNSLSSKFGKDDFALNVPSVARRMPVKSKTFGNVQTDFQETKNLDSDKTASSGFETSNQEESGMVPETVAMDSTPSPPPSQPKPSQPEANPFQDPASLELDAPPVEKVSSDPIMSSSPLSGSSPDLESINSLGRYQVHEVLGKGAMGTVFKGVDPAINRPIALKTIRLDFVSDETEMEELRDRLAREARAVGKLSHPNIVTIYDIGSEKNLHYIAMEYLEGQTLEDLIKRKVQFSYKIIANIISQICLGLQYAHDQGIVHRDIKPANIMVLPDYTVKVMDFGIARVDSSSMTRTGIAMGTPNYIAPELLQGKAVDRRCDIFSLGVVMYELLTTKRPFKGENLTSLIYSIINDDPVKPSDINDKLPLIFDHITLKALAKNPLERFQKVSDILGALSDFVGSFGAGKKVGM